MLLIKALCGLERCISNVNLPNTMGQIANLPKEAVVETNAVFSKNHIHPVIAGDVPEKILPLVASHANTQEDILKAALTCDFGLALKALMEDANTKAKINEQQGREMLKEMIKHTLTYLPEDWKKEIETNNK